MHQLHLLLGERAGLLPIDSDGSDQLLSLTIGTTRRLRAPTVFNQSHYRGLPFDISALLGEVGAVNWLFGRNDASKQVVRVFADDMWSLYYVCRRVASHDVARNIAFGKSEHDAELGFANARGLPSMA